MMETFHDEVSALHVSADDIDAVPWLIPDFIVPDAANKDTCIVVGIFWRLRGSLLWTLLTTLLKNLLYLLVLQLELCFSLRPR